MLVSVTLTGQRILPRRLGGLLVGVVETLSAAYISGQFRDAVALVILMAVLLLKPEGLWGVKEEWSS